MRMAVVAETITIMAVLAVRTFPQAASEAVAGDRCADPSTDGPADFDTRPILGRRGKQHGHAEWSTAHAPAVATDGTVGRTPMEAAQADSRSRPLRRRAASTARPAFVDMR